MHARGARPTQTGPPIRAAGSRTRTVRVESNHGVSPTSRRPESLSRLYTRGRDYARRLAPLAATGVRRGTACRRPSATGRRPAADVRRATAFAAAIDHIAECCGPDARTAPLSRDVGLDPTTVMRIARTHPDRVRFEVARVRAGRAPFAPPPPGTDPPFDTLHYGEVVSRLRRAAGLLDYVTRAGDAVLTGLDLERVRHQLSALRGHCRTVAGHVGSPGGAGTSAGRGAGSSANTNRPTDAKKAGVFVAAAVGFAEKNARDIARLVSESPPTPGQAVAVAAAVARLQAAADRLEAKRRGRTRPPGAGPRTNRPRRTPGTYVVVYHLPTPLRHHAFGRRGTFDYPPGYYLYVGSASARVAWHPRRPAPAPGHGEEVEYRPLEGPGHAGGGVVDARPGEAGVRLVRRRSRPPGGLGPRPQVRVERLLALRRPPLPLRAAAGLPPVRGGGRPCRHGGSSLPRKGGGGARISYPGGQDGWRRRADVRAVVIGRASARGRRPPTW